MMTIRLSLISLLAWIVSACAGLALSGVTPTIEPTAPLLRMTPTAAPSSTQEVNTGKPLREPSPTPAITPTPLSLPLPADTACRADAVQATDLGKLAYVQGGDIWVKPLPDGKPLRLTADGHNREPRWSPSGQWLAFRKGDNVCVMRVDGKAVYFLNSGATVRGFAWAPISDRLAYTTGQGELWTINADNTDPMTLVPSDLPGLGQVGLIAWSPDGAWIAYEWQGRQTNQPSTVRDIWKLSSDGNVRSELVRSGSGRIGDSLLVGWTGDSLALLVQEGMNSASLLADGSPLYSVPVTGGNTMLQGQAAWQVLIQRRVFVANALGEPQPRQLTNDLAYRDERPLWSADGCYILFARLNSEDRASLWLIQAVGGKPQQVVDELTPAPGWFGYYGYIDWDDLFDWWRGPSAITL